MNDPERRALIERYILACNSFDVDGMLATLSDDVRFENWSGGVLSASSSGSAAFRALADQGKAMFAEREQRITALAPRGAALVASIAWRGRLAVDIPDGPPAGTRLELAGESAFGFCGDRIAVIVDRS
jgi:hypothetical protein